MVLGSIACLEVATGKLKILIDRHRPQIYKNFWSPLSHNNPPNLYSQVFALITEWDQFITSFLSFSLGKALYCWYFHFQYFFPRNLFRIKFRQFRFISKVVNLFLRRPNNDKCTKISNNFCHYNIVYYCVGAYTGNNTKYGYLNLKYESNSYNQIIFLFTSLRS